MAEKRQLAPRDALRLLAPGPVALVSTMYRDQPNVMTAAWLLPPRTASTPSGGAVTRRRRPARAPREAQRPEARREETRRDDRRDRPDGDVVGMGDHMPDFLMRRMPVPPGTGG